MGEPRFPYEEFRRGQREFAEIVEKGVSSGGVVLAEAPTGFGKTAATIYGLLLAGAEKVVYVVRTRNEIQPVVRELARFGIDYVFLYSARKMCPMVSRGDIGEEDFWENCRILRLKGLCNYYSLVDEIGVETVLTLVRSSGDNVYGAVRLFAANGVCPFYALRKAIGRARFIVATYPYLFDERIFASVFEPLEYRDIVVVVDEAHSLGEPGYLGEKKLGLEVVRRARSEIEKYYGESGLLSAVNELLEYLARLPPTAGRLKRIDKRVVISFLGDPQEWVDAATDIRLEETRRVLEEEGIATATVRVYLHSLSEFYKHLVMDGIGLYYSRSNSSLTLYALPVDPCSVVSKPLREARAAVLLSGTLPPRDYFLKALCLEGRTVTEYRAEARGTTGHAVGAEKYRTVIASYLTSKYTRRGEDTYRLYAETIELLYQHTGRALLVVFPSYELMHSVARLVGEGVVRVLEDRATTITEVQSIVESRRHVAVFSVASGKLVEGVEYRDREGRSLLETVFLAGVPYPQLDDYLEDYLAHVTGSDDSRRILEALTVLATTRARQALGRAIRSEEDRAIYVLGDHRFLAPRVKELMRIRYHYIARSPSELVEKLARSRRELGL